MRSVVVGTSVTISATKFRPYSITNGLYLGQKGLFIATEYSLLFLVDNVTALVDGSNATIYTVIGPYPAITDVDGPFSSLSTSTYHVSRMSYESSTNVLYIMTSNALRIANLTSNNLWTASTPHNFQSTVQFPLFDVKAVGATLYVSDTVRVYNLTRIPNSEKYSYTSQTYSTLYEYMSYQGWFISSKSFVYITGIEVIVTKGLLCVSVSYSRNVILAIPIDASSYTSVTVLAGDPNAPLPAGVNAIVYSSRDGLVDGNRSSEALLAYPADLAYDLATDSLYFT